MTMAASSCFAALSRPSCCTGIVFSNLASFMGKILGGGYFVGGGILDAMTASSSVIADGAILSTEKVKLGMMPDVDYAVGPGIIVERRFVSFKRAVGAVSTRLKMAARCRKSLIGTCDGGSRDFYLAPIVTGT